MIERGGLLLRAQLQLKLSGDHRDERRIHVCLRHGAAREQSPLAIDIVLLEIDVLLRQIDQGGQRFEIALQIGEIGAYRIEFALCLLERELERGRVDDKQLVAGVDVLALLHRDASDLAGNIRCDQHLLGTDIGVVGGDVASAGEIEDQAAG